MCILIHVDSVYIYLNTVDSVFWCLFYSFCCFIELCDLEITLNGLLLLDRTICQLFLIDGDISYLKKKDPMKMNFNSSLKCQNLYSLFYQTIQFINLYSVFYPTQSIYIISLYIWKLKSL